MTRAVRIAGWLVGVAWLLSWFVLYLEIYRYRHVTLPPIFGGPPATPVVGAGARPGGFLRTVLACSALAPPLFVALRLWRRAAGARAGTARARPEPPFPVASAATALGLALCGLGTLNQVIRHPAFEVDLTLRRGNGGFVVLGGALALAGRLLASARGAPPRRRPPKARV